MNSNRRFFLLFLLLQLLWFSGQNVAAQCYQQQLRPVLKKGKYGAVDAKTGKLVIKPKFAAADSFPGNYLLVAERFVKDEASPAFRQPTLWTSDKVANKLGLVNGQGKLVLPIKYHRISAPDCDHFMVEEKGKAQLLDKNFRVIYEDTAHFIPNTKARQVVFNRRLNDSVSEIKIKDLQTGKLVFQRQAYFGHPVRHNYFEAGEVRKYRNLPFYQIRSRQLIKGETDMAVREYSNVIDRNGTTLFDSVSYLVVRNGFAEIERKSKRILADSNFRIIPAFEKYTTVYKLDGPKPWFKAIHKNQETIIDQQGNIIMPLTIKGYYTYAGKNAFLLTASDNLGNVQVLFPNGRTLDLSKYHFYRDKDSLFLAKPLEVVNKQTGKMGLLDFSGKFLLPETYDNLHYAADTLLFYKKENEIGYLTTTGKTLVPGKYRALSAFKNGYAAVVKKEPQNQNLLTFIDSSGREFPGGFFENVSAFQDGFARVSRNDSIFMIDEKGRRARIGKYLLHSHFSDQKIAVISDKTQTKFGLITITGKVLIKPRYEKISVNEIDRYEGCTCALYSPDNYLPELLTITYPKLENGKAEVSIKVKQLLK